MSGRRMNIVSFLRRNDLKQAERQQVKGLFHQLSPIKKQRGLTWRRRAAPGSQGRCVCVCVSRGWSTDISSTGESEGALIAADTPTAERAKLRFWVLSFLSFFLCINENKKNKQKAKSGVLGRV